MYGRLEDSLTNPVLSTLYRNYHIDHREGSVMDMPDYLQEYEES